MGLERKRRSPSFFSQLSCQTYLMKERISSTVEHDQIVPHIKMAVVINPFGPNDVAMSVQELCAQLGQPSGARSGIDHSAGVSSIIDLILALRSLS